MEKNNNNSNSNSNGFSNSEMYNMSRNGAIESVGFWTADLDYIKEKTTFAKAPNGTIASLCDWIDNGATYYEKVDGRWFELDAERAEAIKAELRERGRKMVEAAKKEMEIKNALISDSSEFANAKNIVNNLIDWKNSEIGKRRILERITFDGCDGNINENTYVYALYEAETNQFDFNIVFDGVDTSTKPCYAESLDDCFSYPVDEELDADEIAAELASWAIGIASDDRVVYRGLQLKSNLGDVYEVLSIGREFRHNEWEWCADLRNVGTNQEVECVGGELQWDYDDDDEEEKYEFIRWQDRVESDAA